MMNEFWNEKYADTEYLYGKEPNAFFREQIEKLSPGTILFPAEGEGRNAVFAATLGWAVDAFDFSDKAREKALQLAEEKSCKINYFTADLAELEIPENNYDAVVLSFVHLPEPIRKPFLQNLIQSLKPQGRLIIEAFSKKQLGRTSGGPKDIDLLYNLSDLEQDLRGLSLIQAEETETALGEGNGHSGLAQVVRIVATK
ncbi:MAG: class I SAM-dependent methyltransferase [Bacteroidales bacterium]|nr:class I SAM-dependent methyltransferase [Bacteroidales bacterium]MCF8458234.1 class I SAM-dependent methyltransferase [Bacteroidales bacterium]